LDEEGDEYKAYECLKQQQWIRKELILIRESEEERIRLGQVK
jgi:hypothetical protein